VPNVFDFGDTGTYGKSALAKAPNAIIPLLAKLSREILPGQA
jgi:hypothetical protein